MNTNLHKERPCQAGKQDVHFGMHLITQNINALVSQIVVSVAVTITAFRTDTCTLTTALLLRWCIGDRKTDHAEAV